MGYGISAGQKVQAADLEQVYRASGPYAASSGGSDTYAITVVPAVSSLEAGMVFHFKADVGNTGPATLNVNAQGAKNLLRPDGSSLNTSDIVAGQFLTVVYDGTNFKIISPLAGQPRYKQTLPICASSTNVGLRQATSENDGSVVYVVAGATAAATAYLTRWVIDPISGYYYKTHEVNMTIVTTTPSPFGIAVLGSYVYAVWKDSGAIYLKRYNKADLTSETTITISGTQPTTPSAMYSDGTDLIINSSGTTWYRYTISGTTATNAATVTSRDQPQSAIYDPVKDVVYMFDNNVLYSYTKTGTLVSTGPTFDFNKMIANDQNGGYGIAIADTTKLYYFIEGTIYNDTGKERVVSLLVPIGKI
jgi:hypothetical protein